MMIFGLALHGVLIRFLARIVCISPGLASSGTIRFTAARASVKMVEGPPPYCCFQPHCKSGAFGIEGPLLKPHANFAINPVGPILPKTEYPTAPLSARKT